MVRRIREGLVSDRVSERILWLTLLFLIELFGAAVLSHDLLPEGFLLGKNSLADFDTSQTYFLCAWLIFLYNMLSVGFIVPGSAFARKREGEKVCRSYGPLLITSALATKCLVMTEGKATRTRSIREVSLSMPEPAALIAGLLLMITGALMESRAIPG